MEQLTNAGWLDAAARSLGEIEADNEGCTRATARLLLRRVQAETAYSLGVRAEASEEPDEAVRWYAHALSADSQHTQAGAALNGLLSADQPAEDPFAGAAALEAIGRSDEATTEALDVITETGSLPSPPDAFGVEPHESWWSAVPVLGFTINAVLAAMSWMSANWVWVAVLLAAVCFGWARFKRSKNGRRLDKLRNVPPRLRLAVTVANATGLKEVGDTAFAVAVREQLAEQDRLHAPGNERKLREKASPRIVELSEVTSDIPTLTDAPGNVGFLVGLWEWLWKNNVMTLRVTLLPAKATTVACHVILVESDGSVVKRTEAYERRLHCETNATGDPPAPEATHWRQLVPSTVAWALFASRRVRSSDEELTKKLGTTSESAYGAFLSGSDVLTRAQRGDGVDREGGMALALEQFGLSFSKDPDYLEARLNFAFVATELGALGIARAQLDDLLARDVNDFDADWIHWMRIRARINLVVVEVNELAPLLPGRIDNAHEILARSSAAAMEAKRLLSDIDGPPGGAEFRYSVPAQRERPFAQLLHAGMAELAAQFVAFLETGDVSVLGLPPDLAVPDDATEDRREALATLRRLTDGASTTRVHYSLACIWARDVCVRVERRSESLDHVRHHLRQAFGSDSDMFGVLQQDPDFAALLTQLTEAEANSLRVPTGERATYTLF